MDNLKVEKNLIVLDYILTTISLQYSVIRYWTMKIYLKAAQIETC